MSRIQTGISSILANWTVPLTVLALWFRYLSRHDYYGTALHILLFLAAIGTAIVFRVLMGATFRRREDGQDLQVQAWPNLRVPPPFGITLLIVGIGVGVISLSVKAINGGIRANLEQVAVSTKPPNWTGKDSEIPLVQGAVLRGADLRDAEAREAFLANADLQRADLSHGYMDEVDLRMANLTYAKLSQTQMIEGDLRRAKLSFA